MADTLSPFLQENLLILLSYSDEQCRIIRGTVDLDLFESYYREIASRIYVHLDQQKSPPKDHLQELFEDILLKPKDARKRSRANHFNSIIYDIYNNRNNVNVKYTMERLEQFIRHQEIKKATLTVAEIVGNSKITDETINRAEDVFSKALKKRISIMDLGTSLGDSNRALSFLEAKERDVFRTGVEDLDTEKLGPSRGALHLFVGLPKQGKTWWLVNLGKAAYKDGHRVLHISLEMSEEQISRRYHQDLFAIHKHRPAEGQKYTQSGLQIAAVDYEHLGLEIGDLRRVKQTQYVPKHSLDDADIHEYLMLRRKRITDRLKRIRVKAFPTGQLTMRNLEGYLDMLEVQEKFVPDLLLVDYPQLMKMDVKYQRMELGQIVRNLRGLAVEKNMAVAAVSQSNRSGFSLSKSLKLPVLTMENIAEDFSQAATVDVILTYNQTPQERELGLARIHVAASRDEEGGFTCLITQNYMAGQFCRQSIRMKENTRRVLLKQLGSEEGEDEDEDEAEE